MSTTQPTQAISAHVRITPKRNVVLSEDQWDELAEMLEMSDFTGVIESELDGNIFSTLIDIDVTFGG